MGKILVVVLILLIISGLGGWYFFNKQKMATPTSQQVTVSLASPNPRTSAQPSTQPSALDTPIPLQERPTAGMVNPSATIAAISGEFSKLNQTQYLDLGAWMAQTVSVTVSQSECCGVEDTKTASTQLNSSVKDAQGPWDCSDNNPIAQQIKSKDPQDFKDEVICTSADRKTIGFHLDDQFLINRINVLADYKQVTG